MTWKPAWMSDEWGEWGANVFETYLVHLFSIAFRIEHIERLPDDLTGCLNPILLPPCFSEVFQLVPRM